MGTQLLERWLRTAAPLVPREGKYWVHADPTLFPISKRQFWRQLRVLDSDWERKRTRVHGVQATIVRPRDGTIGLRIGFLLCHSAFRCMFEACASELKRDQEATRACASGNGTLGSISSYQTNSEFIHKKPLISLEERERNSQNSKKSFGRKKKMSDVKEIVAAGKAKREIKLSKENRELLIHSSKTTQQLGMLWRVLYAERFGYARNMGVKQAAKLKGWSDEFRRDFEAPVGLMLDDVFDCYPVVKQYICKQTGWRLAEAPEKPTIDWLHFNREHVTQWWIDHHTPGMSSGGLSNIGKAMPK